VYNPENKLIENLFHSDSYSKYLNDLINELNSNKQQVYVSGNQHSSKYFFLSHLFYRLNKYVIFVVNSPREAVIASRELSFFLSRNIPYLQQNVLVPDEAVFKSSPDLASQRINSIYNTYKNNMLVCDYIALYEKFIPLESFKSYHIEIKVDDLINRNQLISTLRKYGYITTDFVQKTSEFSKRGSIIDIFSPQHELPVRIEFAGEKIESIRHFYCNNQKTAYKSESVAILPASEAVLNKDNIQLITENIKKFSKTHSVKASIKNSLLDKIENAERPSNINLLMPFLYSYLNTIFDYIPSDSVLIFDDHESGVTKSEELFENIKDDLEMMRKRYKIVPEFPSFYIDRTDLDSNLEKFQKLYLTDLTLTNDNSFNYNLFQNYSLTSINPTDSPYDILVSKLKGWIDNNYYIFFVLKSEEEIQKLKGILRERKIKKCGFLLGNLSRGFLSDEIKTVFITENEIYKRRKPVETIGNPDVNSAFITSFSELKSGDYIVHKNFGIGIYKGLVQLIIKSRRADFLACEYHGGDRVYVPVDNLNIVQRYIGEGKKTVVDRLGQNNWSKNLGKARKAIENIARELLDSYAKRKAQKGFKFSKNDDMYIKLEDTFEHEETKDQSIAINDVLTDMESFKCMDRLICGDVGFGKTEVAIRSAFKAVMDGKQVAVIVPTTLLCLQHFHTFTTRLKEFPIIIEMLSRFRSYSQSKKILNNLLLGKIDIIIGTHKLLGKSVKFRDLGLIIIDEEHKFGVKQKENIRKLKQGVDIIELSATPIPRTLQLSLVNIRDISLINSPPEGRLIIDTYVYQFNEDIIKKAITDELKRGGSVYFIYNRIETIHTIANTISKLLPEVKFLVTHGRMKESILEKSISKFINGEIDMLITTTIVESGLDIPRANTIIVNDAHNFGLADLYQLRGRVGRSNKKAYAYFLIPPISSLADTAKKRLKAISETNELGSGFKLALSDLEIRGAGNLFGTEQSGHINYIGLEMYLEMLDKAVKKLTNQEINYDFEPEIKTHISSYIPKEFIEDDSERLLMYKRLSSVNTLKEIESIKDEIADRFGNFPVSVKNLLNLVEIKIYMKKYLINKIALNENQAILEVLDTSPLNNILKPSGIYRYSSQNKIGYKTIKKLIFELSKKTRQFMNTGLN